MFRLILILNLFFLCTNALAEDLAKLSTDSLEFSLEQDQNEFKLYITPVGDLGDKSLTANLFPVKNPSRLVIDIPGFAAATQKNANIENEFITGIRIGAHSGKTRLVIDIKNNAALSYDIIADEESGKLIATFSIADTPAKASVEFSKKIPSIEDSLEKLANEKIDAAPLPTPKPLAKPTLAATALPTPKPTVSKFQESGTISIKPTPESFVMRGNEQVEAPIKKEIQNKQSNGISATQSVISNILFQAPKDAPLGAIVIEGEKIGDYQLEQKGKNLYELSLKNSKLAGDHLSLPQFPPATFKGFEVILANQEDSNVILKVYVNDGIKIKSYNAKGKLWLKAEK